MFVFHCHVTKIVLKVNFRLKVGIFLLQVNLPVAFATRLTSTLACTIRCLSGFTPSTWQTRRLDSRHASLSKYACDSTENIQLNVFCFSQFYCGLLCVISVVWNETATLTKLYIQIHNICFHTMSNSRLQF